MNKKLTKEEKIKRIVDLLERSYEEYVNDVFEVIGKDDLTYLPNMLGDDDWEALKTMIGNGELE